MMKCPKEVREKCLVGLICEPGREVDEGSECADYIRKVTDAEAEKSAPDPAEEAYLLQEREAIRAASEGYTVHMMFFELAEVCRYRGTTLVTGKGVVHGCTHEGNLKPGYDWGMCSPATCPLFERTKGGRNNGADV